MRHKCKQRNIKCLQANEDGSCAMGLKVTLPDFCYRYGYFLNQARPRCNFKSKPMSCICCKYAGSYDKEYTPGWVAEHKRNKDGTIALTKDDRMVKVEVLQ